MHFVSTDVSTVSCDDFTTNGEFLVNMTAYDGRGWYLSAYPSAAAVESFPPRGLARTRGVSRGFLTEPTRTSARAPVLRVLLRGEGPQSVSL